MNDKAILSKSTFLKGLQCDKHLYLYKHHYNWQDKVSEQQQAIFDRGHNVGHLAQQLFPDGADSSPSNPRAYSQALDYTIELIENGTNVIYEAAFMYNEVLVYADIIVKNGNKWKVYEVKSSTSVSETNINDISVQYYVMSNCGLEIEDISIIYINNEYIRFGELDLSQFFKVESLLPFAIENMDWIDEEVERLKSVVLQKEIPNIDIGLHCSDPYQCSFIGHCWNHIPENSVFDISRMHLTRKFELYDSGIISLDDIPDEFILPSSQQLQLYSYKTGETIINSAAIESYLSTFDYPLYFMDFESFQPAVPAFDNSRPYQQIPFQYSLHYQKSKQSKLEHKEFLAETGVEPRISFLKNLLEDTKSVGKIIVYNKSFEIMILNSIATDFPEFSKEIDELIDRIIDLMIPFQKKWYYAPEMHGSYSIKKVLPALVPELSYEGLNISDGGSASLAFENLLHEKDMFIIEETRKNLLEYCKLDTFAMVEILNKLFEISKIN
ncbi:MAG: DUF2779 domain-containing protein [Ignavibacteriales bacterium]|nr:DUF2779 domain-containing protein [Ignavibacteriales bacterium]MCB9257730.1 DUF2779 domain-containing protein [Ignavibacteriales bacterium]